MIHVEDKVLALPDGRTLAYADNGNTSSFSLVLFLHGAFSVGDASRMPQVLVENNVHFVAPSLPGWGRSSPVHAPSFYATTLATDITALITHLHPQTSKLKLYICGHSFGTVPAQMLYGLPHGIFPLGRQLASLVLIAPLSPPHCHKEYAKGMSWKNYLMAGPPARYTPFNLVMHLVKIFLAHHISSEASAETLIKNYMVETMDEEEREIFLRWREDHGLAEGQIEREIGKNVLRSVAHTWQGFLDIPTIYHSGWGNCSAENTASRCPVLVISCKGDVMSPEAMAQWLSITYKPAKLKRVSGSHISAFFHLEDIWREVFAAEGDDNDIDIAQIERGTK